MTRLTTPSVLLLPLLLSSCGKEEAGFARASVMESLADGIGGPKAIAQPGDFRLENSHAAVTILANRNSLGPALSGGTLVDADLRSTDPTQDPGKGNDQYAELFATANMNIAFTDPEDANAVRILKDGSDGEAVIRVEGPTISFLSLLDALWALVGAPDLYMSTDYISRADEPWFTMRTTVRYGFEGPPGEELPAGEEIPYLTEPFPLINTAIETGLVVGEFYLSGGSVDVFAPGIGFDEDGAVFESMQRGDNTFVDPFQFPFLAGVADGVSYGLAPKDGDLFVPLFTASQTVAVGGAKEGDGTPDRFESGSAITYERYFFVGHGDVGSIVDQYLEARKIPSATVQGMVVEQDTGRPLSGIDVFVYQKGADQPWSQWKTDVHPDDRSADGSFSGQLPVGEWELLVHQRGRTESRRVPIVAKANGEVDVLLEGGRTGVLTFEVRDETGQLVPSKVTLFRLDDSPSRRTELGDGLIGGSPEQVLFSLEGRGTVELADGEYQAVATRGLEYEISVSEPFQIRDGQSAEIDLAVARTVDTEGWVSADLHVHALRSHDSGVSLEKRVTTMVAEGVEFFASTDHDFLVDYAPTVDALGMEMWVQTAVGNETTTVEVGHFLGFPLDHDFNAEAGGGRDGVDWTGKSPVEIVDSLRVMGEAAGYEPAIFVGHPRDGILGYFDQYGFDPYGGTPGVGGDPGFPSVNRPLLSTFNELLESPLMSWDFDGLELLNGKRFELIRTPTQTELDGFPEGTHGVYDFMQRTMEEQEGLESGVYTLSEGWNGHIDDWFALLNLGYKFTVLGNSDTHGTTTTESGCPRNYVMSDTDEPSLIDDQAIADAVKEHRVVASYGPFIQMWLDDEPIGSEVTGGGVHTLTIEAQAPSWMDLDRVELYENGRLIREWDVPNHGDIVRFLEDVEVEPETDSWYVVVVMGEDDLGPLFTPVEVPYVDLQQVVTDALGSVDSVSALLSPAIPIPRRFPIRPYAITNPIWVDLDGDGFDAPGINPWLAQ